MNKINTMRSNDINKMITQYENLRHDGYSCSTYGSVFDFYIADKLDIKIRSSKFHEMTNKWISFLWKNDKNNILLTMNSFIYNYKIKGTKKF